MQLLRKRREKRDISNRFQPIYAQMIDSCSTRRDESNDMCFEAGRCFVPEIASAHVALRNTYHSIRLDELEQESVNCA